jgi:transmembrane sensor
VKTNNVIPFGPRHQQLDVLQSQASDWLARLDAGASEEDRRQLARWLREDPRRAEVLFAMAALWDQMTVLEELSAIFPLKHYTRARHAAWHHNGLILVSAFGGIMVVAGFWSFAARDTTGLLNPSPRMPSAYETAIGEQATVALPDGSTVILNTNTHIDVDFTGTARNVHLTRGEGLFEVAKNRDLPFRVHAGSRVIEAVGTAFAVQHVEDRHVEVTVTEGRVNLKREASTAGGNAAAPPRDQAMRDEVIPLVAGEYAVVDDLVDSIERKQLRDEEMDVQLSWRHGMLLFQDEPLDQVLREVSRYTPMLIELDDSVRQTRVRGYYRAGDVEAMLIALHNNFQIEVERVDENHVRLRAARQGKL